MRGTIPSFFLLIACPGLLCGAETGTQLSLGEPPAWVETLNGFPAPTLATTNEAAEGIYFALIDEQVSVASQESYHRIIKDFVNENGVQNGARLTLKFDPSFQQLFIHQVKLQRGSNSINRLQREKIKLIQQERDLERYIYNGTISAVIFLEDVRAGDRIDYSYTVRGFNPVLTGHYVDSFSSQFATAVGRERFRLLWPKGGTIPFQNHGKVIQPEIRQNGSVTEYVWDQRNVPAIAEEDEVPSWYDDFPWVQLSEFATWKDVAAWAVPLYPTNSVLPSPLAEKVAEWQAIPNLEQRVTAALQFVQDEIRYLGFENGTQSHRPAEPATVFERRFGDCKDKTYLLCAICRHLGFDASPALVHTAYRSAIATWLPSPYAFNHVIARVEAAGKIYWVDPTRSHQRGPIHGRYLPDYGQCLLVRPDTLALTTIPPSNSALSVNTVHEIFRVFGLDKPVTLTVRTSAEGLNAERLRAQTTDISHNELQKRYLNYYARQYPGITISKPLEIHDQQDRNHFLSIEYYQIKDFWTVGADKRERECEFYPQTISDLLARPDTTLRSMPLHIPYPRHEILRTEVFLPEPWELENANEFFTNAAIQLHFKRVYSKDKLLMEYDLRTSTNCVAARDVPAYLKTLDQIEKNLGYSLTWPDESFAWAQLNWSIVSLGAVYSVLILIGGIALYRIGRQPPPLGESEPLDGHLRGLGGWLILIGFSLFLSPFRIALTVVKSAPSYSMSTWHTLTDSSGGAYHALWAPLLITVLLANLTLLGCSILLLTLYFGKRRIFPRVFIAFLLLNAAIVLTNHFGAQFVLGDKQKSVTEDTRVLSRACISCFIWIPYMLKSRRVKATFVR